MVEQCRKRASIFDPEGSGIDEETNDLCALALNACVKVDNSIYELAHKSPYDIRLSPEISISAAYQEYLNTADVMQSIGAEVNYTQNSVAVLQAFSESGDYVRGSKLQSLADLLKRGIRVAFIYGDA